MNTDALMLFFRYPTYGRVKTRIAAELGNDITLGLYEAFIRDLLSLSGSVRADTMIAVDRPDEAAGHPSISAMGCPVIGQRGGDIGVRMHTAMVDAFNSGYERVVLVGSDVPDLPPGIINDAFDLLRTVDAVLGPSNDGGYYLVGFNRGACDEAYFTGITWGSRTVCRSTVDKINSSGKILRLMPAWNDIDDRGGLKRFFDEKNRRGDLSTHTMQYLVHNIEDKRVLF